MVSFPDRIDLVLSTYEFALGRHSTASAVVVVGWLHRKLTHCLPSFRSHLLHANLPMPRHLEILVLPRRLVVWIQPQSHPDVFCPCIDDLGSDGIGDSEPS